MGIPKLIVLIGALSAPELIFGGALSVSYTDTPLVLLIQGSRNTFDGTHWSGTCGGNNVCFSADGYWSFTLLVTEDQKFFDDLLTLSGNTDHLKPPPGLSHLGDGVGDPNQINVSVDSGNVVGTTVSNSTMDVAAHGPHSDDLRDTLTAVVHCTPLCVSTSIISYSFTIKVTHCSIAKSNAFGALEDGTCPAFNPPGPPVVVDVQSPEAGTGTLAALGILLILWITRSLRCARK